jgi:hypothetical protein
MLGRRAVRQPRTCRDRAAFRLLKRAAKIQQSRRLAREFDFWADWYSTEERWPG